MKSSCSERPVRELSYLLYSLLIPFGEIVQKFAKEQLAPKVQEMDEKELLDSGILKGLFDQGLMGIETESEYDGAGSSFTSAIVVVEELAKVDPAVSVVCGMSIHTFL
jgi:alkylation response protein AidB-like acyl-CoA dehydrogenase